MALDYSYFQGSKNPLNIFQSLKFNREFMKSHPNYFHPEGITIFCGSQGEGKTLSAVQLCQKILKDYPKAIFCTNLDVKGITNETYEFKGFEDLTNVSNGEHGVVYLIDEIQNYLNSLLSKDVPLSVIVELTQQRKQRKIIIGTSQVYGRMAKPLREQVKNVIICNKKFWFIQYNQLIDSQQTQEVNGQLITYPKATFIWFHHPKNFKAYDSYKKQYGLTRPEKSVVVINQNNL